jgi:hypothetical protein
MPRQPMTPEEYEEWRSHPGTEEFFRYLADFRETLLRTAEASFRARMQDSWAPETVANQARLQTEFSSKAQILEDLVNLEHQAIKEFYEPEPQQDPAR